MSKGVSTIVVSGGRDRNLTPIELDIIDYIWTKHGADKIIVGDAVGVDTDICTNFDPVEMYEADWGVHGRAAGVIRNKEMIEDGDMLLAFPGAKSKGTYHAINAARDKGIPTIVFYEGG